MRAVSTVWAIADDAASVTPMVIAAGNARQLGFFFMGSSSGLVFFERY
jgi:hypothetical protein